MAGISCFDGWDFGNDALRSGILVAIHRSSCDALQSSSGHFASRFVSKPSSNIGTMTMSWMERSVPLLVRLKVSCDSVLLSLDRYSLPMLSTLT